VPQQSHVKRATKKTEFSNFLSGLTNSFPHFGQLTLWHVITKSTYFMNEIALYENMLSQRVTTDIFFIFLELIFLESGLAPITLFS
jgi:hypothetical protein